jgi:hypothetical protein
VLGSHQEVGLLLQFTLKDSTVAITPDGACSFELASTLCMLLQVRRIVQEVYRGGLGARGGRGGRGGLQAQAQSQYHM